MIVSGRAITLAALSLCVLLSQVPARAQVYAPRTAVIAQSGAKPRPGPLPPPRPIALPYPFRPLPPVPPPAPPPRPRPSLMPQVIGMPLAGAEAVLARQGLKPSDVARVASNAEPNTVVDQQPQPGQPVTEASRIVLSVANSAVMVRVPDLRGLTPQQAGPTLRAVGLTPGRQSQVFSSQRPPGRIVDTRPAAGAQTQRGAAVDYQIARMPPPPPRPPVAIIPPPPPPLPIVPSPSPTAQIGGGQEPPRPVKPTPVQPVPIQPAPIQPAPVRPAPVRPAPASSAPASSAPASSAPASSAAPEAASAAPASASPVSGPPPALTPPPQPAATGPLGWAQTHPGWLAALAAALAAGAAAGGWALRRRPVPPSPTVIPVLPVTVTVSMLTAPSSTIENAQPATGPAIGIAWSIEPPETRLESAAPKEPSP